jgi:kynureninase
MSTPAIRAAYSRFLDSSEGRILLSGHSHQAWPDVARDAQLEVFDDAARLVDDKWERVFEIQNEVGRAVLSRLGFAEDDAIAFGESTHQLIYRLFSALDLKRAHVVTTTGEFHSLYRQLARLGEDGLRITWVDAHPREGMAERLLDAIEEGVTVVALSAVMFEDAYIVPDLLRVIQRAREVGAIPLVDAYHGFNVVPLTWGAEADGVYVVAGGYKYAGIGNGLCWMRLPPDCALRPAYTGWFADFSSLAQPRALGKPVAYGPGGMRFAGATFDASAMYRARAVMNHWDRLGLDVPALRAISTSQTKRIMTRLGRLAPDLEVISATDDQRRAGFVTVRHDKASAIVSKLRERNVLVDARGSLLRIGPAPYLLDEEIDRGIDIITETITTL